MGLCLKKVNFQRRYKTSVRTHNSKKERRYHIVDFKVIQRISHFGEVTNVPKRK